MAAFKEAFPEAEELGRPRTDEAAPGSEWGKGGCPTLLAAGLAPEQARLHVESWGPAMQVILASLESLSSPFFTDTKPIALPGGLSPGNRGGCGGFPPSSISIRQ